MSVNSKTKLRFDFFVRIHPPLSRRYNGSPLHAFKIERHLCMHPCGEPQTYEWKRMTVYIAKKALFASTNGEGISSKAYR